MNSRSALDDAVKLEGLAGGELDRCVGELRGNLIHLKPLRWRCNTTWDSDADHETVGFFQLMLTTVRAEIAVVLLVSAVEFQELLVILAHGTGDDVGKALLNRSAQVVAVGLDVFVGR